ncbi:glucan endo-1,3-beta-glucosidase-like isoform X2 [Macadamia integrifolia]|uniref:glucan endo-1,3-beta-glucosidase-like isoform X2 n=1 Tax=Macadamia integrifolia TaxID=60698 RepID=UPI001C4EC0C8|nr:glucan endo-1,3-beta-glucosidase-like isoform X2 [Macadamia integrifolia]
MDATPLILVGLLMVCLNRTGAQSGVCCGMSGDNLPSPKEVVDLYKSQNITRMRLFGPNQEIFQALRDTNIELILGIPESDLEGIASSNLSTAIDWVNTNIIAYYPSVRFLYIANGNEVSPITNSNAQFFLPAMQNIYDQIAPAGLDNQIKVSTIVSAQILGTSNPPSKGAFRDDVGSFINPIILFLVQKGSPLLANVYPYFSYSADQQGISLSYALFTSQSIVVQDGKLGYRNLFDSIVNTLYSALEKLGASTIEIVVSESGWPSEGGTGASMENARVYNSNLLQHMKGGTLKRPGKEVETYVFNMFDENDYKHFWGLYLPNKQPKYGFNFSSPPTNSPPSESNKPNCINYYITLHYPSPI